MIHIDGNFYLDADSNCYILHEWDGTMRIKGKKEAIVPKQTRYYKDLDSLIYGVFNALLRADVQKAKDLSEIVGSIARIKNVCVNIGYATKDSG